MIYSVVPEELAEELYDKLVEYYKDDPNVTVIVDRRSGERRGTIEAGGAEAEGRREIRDRRRPRIPGEFPPIDSSVPAAE
jgi:hypothetical protein